MYGDYQQQRLTTQPQDSSVDIGSYSDYHLVTKMGDRENVTNPWQCRSSRFLSLRRLSIIPFFDLDPEVVTVSDI